MYTDPEEARSDLFLAGAVYLFGPVLLRFANPLFGLGILGQLLTVVTPLLVTAMVPILLARYRGNPGSHFGLGGQRFAGLQWGLLLALPIVGALAVALALQGVLAPGTLPALVLAGGSLAAFAANVAGWVGLGVLAVFATVKARDAFRSDLRSTTDGVNEVGRVLGIAGGVAALLLVATQGLEAIVLLLPLGVAGSVALLLRRISGAGTSTRATLIAPVVLLAIGPFNPFALFFSAGRFVFSVWAAAIVGAFALIVAGSLERQRTAWPTVALTGCLALFVPVSFILIRLP
ncbi:MAG: hypothetical protein GEU81_17365 [Nitriliruptorales bacterium]|nr:hypothetical protein [Nitriliruptorales bacterium]